MERLTREVTIITRGKESAVCNCENDDCNDSCIYGTCRWQKKANMLLKKYEDTGLTPEQIMELKHRDTEEEISETQSYGVYFYECPICNEPVHEKDNFCCKCGQRLKRKEYS